jgi:uncharacterized protein (TIGR02271 family)
LYDSRTDAEAARARLTATNIDADNVRIVDQNEAGGFGGGSSDSSGSSGHGFWASIKDVFVPDEDRHSYDEGLRRGGVMLYASVDDDDVDRAIAVLDETGSVDMEERESSWRSEGWAGYTPSTGSSYGSSSSMGNSSGLAATGAAMSSGHSNEEHIQLAEEELRVGKREVNRGGARIRTYVTERPVQEQVTLREEHVNIERRPVDSTTGSANLDNGALFQERTIEMTETAEEAVVDKRARVTEELVVSKTAEERTETVSDTVRKTEVDIDETTGSTGSTGSSDRGLMGGSGSSDRDRF